MLSTLFCVDFFSFLPDVGKCIDGRQHCLKLACARGFLFGGFVEKCISLYLSEHEANSKEDVH